MILIQQFQVTLDQRMDKVDLLWNGPQVHNFSMARCCLCYQGFKNNISECIVCTCCRLRMHKQCYGYVQGTEQCIKRVFMCQRCLFIRQNDLSFSDVQCQFCPNVFGIMRRFHFKQVPTKIMWCHISCAKYIPEIYLQQEKIKNQDYTSMQLQLLIGYDHFQDRSQVKCNICKNPKGFAIKCCYKHCYHQCQTNFHVSCAIKEKINYYYKAICWMFPEKNIHKFYCKFHLISRTFTEKKNQRIKLMKNVQIKRSIKQLISFCEKEDQKIKLFPELSKNIWVDFKDLNDLDVIKKIDSSQIKGMDKSFKKIKMQNKSNHKNQVQMSQNIKKLLPSNDRQQNEQDYDKLSDEQFRMAQTQEQNTSSNQTVQRDIKSLSNTNSKPLNVKESVSFIKQQYSNQKQKQQLYEEVNKYLKNISFDFTFNDFQKKQLKFKTEAITLKSIYQAMSEHKTQNKFNSRDIRINYQIKITPFYASETRPFVVKKNTVYHSVMNSKLNIVDQQCQISKMTQISRQNVPSEKIITPPFEFYFENWF